MLSATGLGKRFGPRWLFRGVEFCLKRGEVLVVTGPNGSGKSTLLKVLAGLEPATVGSASCSGSPVGYMSPELGLYSALTGQEHLELAARLRGVAAGDLARADLGEAAGVRTDAYSTGMKARLRLALAVQHDPGVLLLDEPGVSLDEEGRALVERVIEAQRARGVVVLATNDPSERRFGEYELRMGE